MSFNAIDFKYSFKEDDLITPSSSQKYPLGTILKVIDSSATDAVKEFMYVKSHAALTAYQPYVLNYINTSASEIITAAPATQTQPIRHVVVPQVAFTSGYYGFVQYKGQCTAKIDAETYAANDPLEVITTGTTFIVNGTSGTPLIDNKTAAISQATGSSATTITVYLVGDQVQIAAT